MDPDAREGMLEVLERDPDADAVLVVGNDDGAHAITAFGEHMTPYDTAAVLLLLISQADGEHVVDVGAGAIKIAQELEGDTVTAMEDRGGR